MPTDTASGPVDVAPTGVELAEQRPRGGRWPGVAAVAVGAAVTVAGVAVGSALVAPGGSLAAPCAGIALGMLLVLGIGVAVLAPFRSSSATVAWTATVGVGRSTRGALPPVRHHGRRNGPRRRVRATCRHRVRRPWPDGGPAVTGPRGLAYVVGPAGHAFPDECVRHLTDDGWAFTGDPGGVTGYADYRGGG